MINTYSNQLIRTIKSNEYDSLLELLDIAYGNAHSRIETKRQLSSTYFEPQNCFVTTENNHLTSSIALTKLPKPRWYVLRYLSLRDAKQNLALGKSLVQRAVEHAKSLSVEYLRSTTPRIQLYTTIYEQAGFRPVRRDFRIHWTNSSMNGTVERSGIHLKEVKDANQIDLASEVFVRSIDKLWNWRTIEQDGEIHVKENFKRQSHYQKWMLVMDNDENVVGLTGLIPNEGGPGKARFRGAYVLPEYRRKGYGTRIMRLAFDWARKLDQNEMVIYTFSYLDRYAPGAALYLKSGGKIESEYLQFEKNWTNSRNC